MPITGNNGTGQVLDDSCGPNYDLQVGAFSDFGSFFDKYSERWVNRRGSGCQSEKDEAEKPLCLANILNLHANCKVKD